LEAEQQEGCVLVVIRIREGKWGCRWELFASQHDSDDHGTGYTNGHDWLCTECWAKFWERPDFFSSSYSDITYPQDAALLVAGTGGPLPTRFQPKKLLPGPQLITSFRVNSCCKNDP
jgi:hypothetical protein